MANIIRGMLSFGNELYVVRDGYLFEINTSDVVSYRGGLDTSTGSVTMATNGLELMIADGTDGYVLNLTTHAYQKIDDADFPGAGSVAYQDGYFIVNDPGEGTVYISNSYDGLNWDALDYGTAESAPDDVVRVFSAFQELWVFGVSSTEVWYNSGNADYPFERMAGGVLEEGLIAVHSPATVDNGIAWLTDKKQVVHARGMNPVKISTPQIEYQIAQYTDVSDAIGFSYIHEGHEFYVLTFPTGDATWVFDAATGFWHERSSYKTVSTTGRWRANCYAFFNNKHLVGDYAIGKIYELDYDTYTDNYHSIQRIRTAQSINNSRKNMFIHRFEVEFEAGVGVTNPTTTAYAAGTTYDEGDYVTSGGKYYISLLDSNVGHTPASSATWWEEIEATIWTGNDPQASLDYSVDGGHTFSNTEDRSIGTSTAYTTRAVWRRKGRGRDWIPRVTITAPVKVVIIGATLEATPGVV